MADNSCVVLEYAFFNEDNIRIDDCILCFCESGFCSAYSKACKHIEALQLLGCQMIYAKIRKIRFVQDICLKYNDKGELENEFCINPNKK